MNDSFDEVARAAYTAIYDEIFSNMIDDSMVSIAHAMQQTQEEEMSHFRRAKLQPAPGYIAPPNGASEWPKNEAAAQTARESGPFSPAAIAEKLKARGGFFGVDRTFAPKQIPIEPGDVVGWDWGLPPLPGGGPQYVEPTVNRNNGGAFERETATKCSAGAACPIHHPKKVEPWRPSIDEWDLLPDAPTYRERTSK